MVALLQASPKTRSREIYNLNPEIHLGLFITADNQETVFANIEETAPFTLDKISAFTGTQPQPPEFYADLHQQGIVAIQGLFGTQEAFDNTAIDNLSNQKRESLFTSVYDAGADIIATDYYQQIAEIIGYPVEDELDILIVNDDGFDAEGINVLFDSLTEAGYNVNLVAPKEQQSGRGTLINADTILQPTEVVKFADNKWFVDGSLVTTTLAGLDFILEEKPDLVISGINEGENISIGGAVSSGTVSAAVTAILRDVPAIAVSAGIDITDPKRTATSEAYQIGADYITNLIAQLQATQGEDATVLPAETGLSINIPVGFPDSVNEIQAVALTEPDDIEPFVLDFGELPQGGAGLRLFPTELPLF